MLTASITDILTLAVGTTTGGTAIGMWIGYTIGRCRRLHARAEAEPTVPMDLLPGRHRDHTPAPLAEAVAAYTPGRRPVPSPPPPAWATAPTGRMPHADQTAILAGLHARRTGEQPRFGGEEP